MPFKSKAQMRHYPQWLKETLNPDGLPEKVASEKKKEEAAKTMLREILTGKRGRGRPGGNYRRDDYPLDDMDENELMQIMKTASITALLRSIRS